MEVTCPECWTITDFDEDDSDERIICQECNYEYYAYESVGD